MSNKKTRDGRVFRTLVRKQDLLELQQNKTKGNINKRNTNYCTGYRDVNSITADVHTSSSHSCFGLFGSVLPKPQN